MPPGLAYGLDFEFSDPAILSLVADPEGPSPREVEAWSLADIHRALVLAEARRWMAGYAASREVS